MLCHIVMFRPRPDLSRVDQDALAAAFQEAVTRVPSVRRFHIGRRVTHGRGYEEGMSEDMSFGVVIEFDDLPGLKAYLEHPAHQQLGARFMSSVAATYVYDFDMPKIDAIRDLLD